jgi:hypothetical protein
MTLPPPMTRWIRNVIMLIYYTLYSKAKQSRKTRLDTVGQTSTATTPS